MRRHQVVVVDAVLDQELPVRLDVVLLHAGDDLHAAGWRLLDHEIDVVPGARQVGDEVDGVAIEVEEPEVAVALEPRHRDEAHLRFVEARRIGLLARHVAQAPVHAVGPAVIHAVEVARIASRSRQTVEPRCRHELIRQRISPARSRQKMIGRPAAQRVRKSPGLLSSEALADIDPALVEQRPLLALQHVARDEHLAADLERHGLPVLDHQRVAVGMPVVTTAHHGFSKR